MNASRTDGVCRVLAGMLFAAAGAAVLSVACVAPMCRTAAIPPGMTLSAQVGPTAFRSTGIIDDTSSWWGGRTVGLTYLGLQGDVRAGYGFTKWFGADFTAGLNSGSLVHRPESLSFQAPGSWRLGLAALFRPWQSNSQAFVEYQIPHFFSVGWVQGFPLHDPEQWSVMAQTGFIPFYVAMHGVETSWRDFVPEIAQLAFRRNFRVGRTTLAPSLGGTVTWNWENSKIWLDNGTLGLIWSSSLSPH